MAGQGSKGGGQVVAPMAGAAPASGMTPLAPTAGFNVNQASAGALQGALGGTQAAMTGPLQVGAYMNPYTQNVIDRTQQDIARQQEMAMNQLGAQATRARAFGGSRQGVAEGVAAGEFGRMAGDIAAQQRQTGYNTAMQQAMADRQARPWRSIAAWRIGPAGIWHRPSDPETADAAGPHAADVAAVSDRRGEGPICRLYRRTAGSACSAIGGAWSNAKSVHDHHVKSAWSVQLPSSADRHGGVWLNGLPPSSHRCGTQIRDRPRHVCAPHTAGEQL